MPSSDPNSPSTSFLQPLAECPREVLARVNYVLTDIDDTLTTDGRLPAVAYGALEALQAAGLRVVPITGRPAGWCDHIARMWPVDGVVGENGAFYFHYQTEKKRMLRRFAKSDSERMEDRVQLEVLKAQILREIPGAAVASDQAYREADLAIDFCEDVAPLSEGDVARIVACFEQVGATAKVSSIHVNGWFGSYDKLSMSRLLMQEVFGKNLGQIRDQVIYCGDSPNDSPMFAYFPHGVGVANVRHFIAQMPAPPRWVTDASGGEGFAELAMAILAGR